MSFIRKVLTRMTPFMEAKGFVQCGKNYHYVSNNIAYCVAFDAPGGLLYVTAYIMPLYIPCENRYYTYGRRLSELRGCAIPSLTKDDNAALVDQWCENLCRCLEDVVIPQFHRIGTPDDLAYHADNNTTPSGWFFPCPPVFVERLKTHTYLYLKDYSKTAVALRNYRELLENCTFLTVVVRNKYIEEINTVELLLDGCDADVSNFCFQNIDVARKVLMQ